MKIMKTITVPQTERIVLDKIVCDLCGIESRYESFNNDNYVVSETEVHLKTGEAYPESGMGTKVTFHICQGCFENKLIPWMKSQGAAPTETEWGY